MVTGISLYVVWIAGTLIGALLGPVLGDPNRLGLDAAFPAGFVALLWPMLSGRHAVRCAIGGGGAAPALAPVLPPGGALAGGAPLGVLLGPPRRRRGLGSPAPRSWFRAPGWRWRNSPPASPP